MQAKEPYNASKRAPLYMKIALLCKQKSPIIQAKEAYFSSKRPNMQAKDWYIYDTKSPTRILLFSFCFEHVSTRRRRNPCLAALVTPSLPSSLNSCSLLEKERAVRDERRSCARGRATAGRVTWWSPSKRRT